MPRIAAIFVAFVLGCASVPQLQRVERPEPASSRWIIMAPDLAPYLPEWDRRFAESFGHTNFRILVAHGAEHKGDWYLGIGNAKEARPVMPWRLMVKATRMQVKDDTELVVLSCNEGGVVLGLPHVWQPVTVLWAKPGDDIRRLPDGSMRHLASDVDDFICVAR
jgi:hypothetical protein